MRRAPAAMLLDVDYAAQVELGFGDGLRPMGVMKDTRTSNFGAGVLYTSEWADRAADVDDLPGWLPADEDLPTDDSWSQTTRVSMGYGAGQLVISGHKPAAKRVMACLLYTSPRPRDRTRSSKPSSA